MSSAWKSPVGVVVAFGGQTAIKLTKYLDEHGIPILGTSAEGIDTAEDREKFDALLESFGIRRPRGMAVHGMEEALQRGGCARLSRPASSLLRHRRAEYADRAEAKPKRAAIWSAFSATGSTTPYSLTNT